MKTTTRERAIRLTDAQVRAALDGRLSEVREPVKGVPDGADEVFVWPSCRPMSHHENPGVYARKRHTVDTIEESSGDGWLRRIGPTPYGQPGDVLWAQETFQVCDVTYDYYNGGWEGGYPLDTIPREKPDFHHCVTYAADGDEGPWRPSTQMPRWASRIEFEVTAVRVERLSEITEAGAIAEGASSPHETCDLDCSRCGGFGRCPRAYLESFVYEWNRRNPRHPFDSDCWVWVREVRRIKP